jgi:hypothetical protein
MYIFTTTPTWVLTFYRDRSGSIHVDQKPTNFFGHVLYQQK